MSETLWGVSQVCDFEIQDPENSIFVLEEPFDDQTASCTGAYAADQKAWQYTAFQPASLAYIEEVKLEIRYFITGLEDDRLAVEVFDGSQWQTLQEYRKKTAPPASLETSSFDASPYLDSLEKINQASVRFIGKKVLGPEDAATIFLDGARLIVSGQVEPPATPTPTDSPTATPTVTPSPTSTVVSSTVEATATTTATVPLTVTLSPTITPTPVQTPTTPITQKPAAQILPLPTPTIPAGVAADPRVAGDPHGDNAGMTDSCSGCHNTHAAGGIALRQSWPEESVCYACHAGNGGGTNVQPAFSSYTNTLTAFFKHDVGMTNGLHRLGQASGADFGGGNRHIECEDCHDPHYAARGATDPPMVQLEMAAISGVEPQWSGPGAPASFTWLGAADREYQVCFKCHSSYTTLPGYAPDGWNGVAYVPDGLRKLTAADPLQVPDRRDLAWAFNPNQASFHPVVTVGRNQDIAADTFVGGWSQTSMVYCTDCHASPASPTQGDGPHGSPNLHILKGQANYSTVYQSSSPRVSDQEICFICHSYQAYVTGDIESSNFIDHKKHLNEDWGTTCYTCHNSHGSEQQHLINFDASVVTFLNGTDSQSAWYPASGNGRAGCTLICHGEEHNPEEYTP